MRPVRAFAFLSLAAAATVVALLWGSGGGRPAGLAPEPVAASSSADPAAAASRATSEPVRVAVEGSRPASDAPGTAACSLLVSVVWARDKSPAADVNVSVLERGRPRAFPRHAVTDARGQARFELLRAGDANVTLDRQVWGRVKLEEHKQAELALEIKPGVDARGVVVDSGDAVVPHAEVLLLDFSGLGHVVARADREGRFLVRAVAWAQHIGARAPGYAPSAIQQLHSHEGGAVEIRLVLPSRGGEVTGTVLDPEGQPVAGAAVYVGDPRFMRVAHFAARSSMARTKTDGRGEFRAVGVAPGQNGVLVRADGFAIWRGTADVLADSARRVEARLAPGASLAGTVSTFEKKAVGNAEVAVGGGYGPFGSAARTAADGSFRLEHLEPGEAEVRVDSNATGNGAEKVVLVEGQETRLDFVFPASLSIHGRVVDASGKPLENWWLAIEDQSFVGSAHDHGSTTTDAEGRFKIANMHERPHRLRLHAPKSSAPSLLLEDVAPSGGELLLKVPADRFPSVRLVGTVLDHGGRPIPGTMLAPYPSFGGGGFVEKVREDTGRFELGPYPSGEWSLNVTAPNQPGVTLGPKQLAPNETWDLGVITVHPPGTFALELVRGPGVAAEAAVTAEASLGGRYVQCEVERKADTLVSKPLNAGEYSLRIGGPAVASQIVPCTIVSGAATRLRVELAPGRQRAITVVEGEPDPKLKTVRLLVRSADGKAVVERSLWRSAGKPFEAKLALAPGSYVVTAATKDGKRAEAALVVAEAEGAQEPLVLALR